MRYQVKRTLQGASNTGHRQSVGKTYEYLHEARLALSALRNVDKVSHHVYFIVDTATGQRVST